MEEQLQKDINIIGSLIDASVQKGVFSDAAAVVSVTNSFNRILHLINESRSRFVDKVI